MKTEAELLRAIREQNTMLGMRGEVTIAQFVEGFDYLLAKIQNGDPIARALLKSLRDRFHELESLALSIEVPRQ